MSPGFIIVVALSAPHARDLDGWLASLGVGKAERDFLGRWSTSTTDAYIRTACRVVENLQRLAAEYGRRALDQGPDFFGEEEVLIQLRAFLRDNGVEDLYADSLVKNLTSSDASLVPTVLVNGREVATAALPEMGASSEEDDESSESESENEDKKTPKAKGGPASAAAPLALAEDDALNEVLPADKFQEALAALEDPPPPSAGFVTAITKRGKHRKLHFVQSCPFAPGVHYKEWKSHGDLLPGSEEYDSVCGRCLPGGTAALEELPEVSSEISLSSSSSDGEEEPPPKRAKEAEDSAP